MRLYLVCPECHHVYRTRFNLVFDLFRMFLNWKRFSEEDTPPIIHWIRRPKHIYSCPHCVHDF